MLIKSQLVTQVSGSVGGLTGSHNRGGMYFRARAVPVNPQTDAQLAARAALVGISGQWAGLTAIQRTAWNDWADTVTWTNALGATIQVSGQNAYLASNVARVSASNVLWTPLQNLPLVSPVGDRVDDAPTVPGLTAAGGLTLAQGGSPNLFTLTITGDPEWAETDDAALLIYLSRPRSPGRVSPTGVPFRLAWAILGNNGIPPTGANVDAIAPTYVPAAGQLVRIRWRAILPDGRFSAVGESPDLLTS